MSRHTTELDRAAVIEFAPDAVLAVDEAAEIVFANARTVELFGYTELEMLGQPLDLLLPDSGGDWLTRGDLKLQNLDRRHGREPHAEGRRRDGTEFRCEIAISAMNVEGGRLAIASIRDVTERDAAGIELDFVVRKLRAAAEVAVAIGTATDVGGVLGLIVYRGRQLVGARMLMVILEEGGELTIAALAGERGEQMRGRKFRDMDEIHEELGLGVGDEWLGVPLKYRNHPLGTVLVVGHGSGAAAFSEHDYLMLVAFAASVAVAVATAQSVEGERGRWARALHDETLQGLASVKIALDSALHQATPEEMRVRVEGVAEQVTEQIRLLRALVTELRPPALDTLGLEAALQGLADRSEQMDGLTVGRSFSLEGCGALNSEIETTIYRLVQEGLNNVAKHAGDTAAELTVSHSTNAVRIRIRDRGVGFDPELSAEGYGLCGMREQAELVGGSIEVDSQLGRGTEIRVEIPTGSAPLSYGAAMPLALA
jgi:two-component system, NarL family, sensor histidine kinase DevS